MHGGSLSSCPLVWEVPYSSQWGSPNKKSATPLWGSTTDTVTMTCGALAKRFTLFPCECTKRFARVPLYPSPYLKTGRFT